MDLIGNFSDRHYWEIDSPNDRRILVLLKHKEQPTKTEKYRLSKLSGIYPDNQKCEKTILLELQQRGLVEKPNTQIAQDANGNLINRLEGRPQFWQTTKQGEMALKNKLFASEYFGKKRDRFFRDVQSIGIWIAATGGLLSIFSFFRKLFNG